MLKRLISRDAVLGVNSGGYKLGVGKEQFWEHFLAHCEVYRISGVKRCGLSLSVLQQLVILIIKNKLVSDSTSRHSGYEKVSSQEETIHLQVKYISIGCTSVLNFLYLFFER